MNIFVFDIETIPDPVLGRKLLGLPETYKDEEVIEAMQAQSMEKQGTTFVRHHCHKIVAISAVFRHRDSVRVWSLGEPDSDEPELIERFFAGINKFMPTLVSWNGSGFDLPVMHYRALFHGIKSHVYWETGDFDSHFKWNNYLNRYHARHLDLMDLLACYQTRANAPLEDIALGLGLPGKMGMSGAEVWPAYQAGDIQSIRNYCETDVLNTYLVYLRFELIRDRLTLEEYQAELDQLSAYLEQEQKPHFDEFLNQWQHKVK